MKNKSSLRKKLASYSALANAVLAMSATKADAQIVYVDLDPDTNVSATDNLYLDLNIDSVFDFQFTYSEWGNSTLSGGSAKIWALYSNSFWAYSQSNNIGYTGWPFPLLEGDFIEGTNGFPTYSENYWRHGHGNIFSWGYNFNGSTSGANGWQGGPFFNLFEDRYLAFILKLPDGKHYGWMRIYNCAILKDYAYEAIPDSSILAGQKEIATTAHPTINNSVQSLSLTPNPTHSFLTINAPSLDNDATITIFDASGRKIVLPTTFINKQAQVNTASLSAGIYLVQILYAKTGECVAGKFVKK